MYNKKYQNIETTYWEPITGRVVYYLNSRLIHVTNGDYSQYLKDPVGQVVKKSGRSLITISVKVLEEHYTKTESDIHFLNHIEQNSDKEWVNTASVSNAIARLKQSGITESQHNSTIKSQHNLKLIA
jgi:hypothetical protein